MSKVAFPVDVDSRKYTQAMKMVANDALPSAVAETLNVTADATTKQQIKNVKRSMKVRTPFTLRSMESPRAKPYKALNKASGKKIERMFSRAGTFSPYLWRQEKGGKERGLSGAVPIPTLQARTGKNIDKSIKKANRLDPSQNLQDGPFGASGKRFIGVPRGKVKGKKRPRGLYERAGNNKRLLMLRNLESDQIKIKPTQFHKKAADKYGTTQFIKAQWEKIAQREIDKKVARSG